MLNGSHIRLRLIKQSDLPELYEKWNDAELRGPYYPLSLVPEPLFYQGFAKDGFMSDDSQRMLIVDEQSKMLGLIHSAKAVSYSDCVELSYILFNTAKRNKGYATEAVKLLVDFIFKNYRLNRIQICVPEGNKPSMRVAEKAGFKHEGVARESFFLNGENVDTHIYSILRKEWIANQ